MSLSVKYNSFDDVIIRFTVKRFQSLFLVFFCRYRIFFFDEYTSVFFKELLIEMTDSSGRSIKFGLEQGFLLVPEFVCFVKYLGKIYAYLLEKR